MRSSALVSFAVVVLLYASISSVASALPPIHPAFNCQDFCPASTIPGGTIIDEFVTLTSNTAYVTQLGSSCANLDFDEVFPATGVNCTISCFSLLTLTHVSHFCATPGRFDACLTELDNGASQEEYYLGLYYPTVTYKYTDPKDGTFLNVTAECVYTQFPNSPPHRIFELRAAAVIPL